MQCKIGSENSCPTGMHGITTVKVPGTYNTEEEALIASYKNLERLRMESKGKNARRSRRSSRRRRTTRK